MKSSEYNIWLNDNLCFNTLTSGFVEFNSESLDFYNKVSNNKIDVKKLDEKESLMLYQLKIAKMVVDDDFEYINPSKLIYLKNTFDSETIALTILPTLRCNCNCTYCYEGNKIDTMDDQTANAIKDYTNYYLSSKPKLLAVSWYGGEPLLEFDRIISLSDFFIEGCEKRSVNYIAEIMSNCLLMTKPIAKKLKELKINKIQVTLDGKRDSHNRKRISSENKPTFNKILENILIVAEHLEVAVRVNVDNTFLEEVDQFFYDITPLKGAKNIGLYPGKLTSDVTSACSSIESSCLNNKDFANVFYIFYKKAVENGFPFTWAPGSRTGGCIATNPYGAVISPNGDMCRCWSQVGEKSESYANIKENRICKPENYYKWVFYDPHNNKECIKCIFFPMCKAGCPAKNVPATSPYMDRNTNADRCTIGKYNLKEMLLLTYQIKNSKREK